jgi:hypothetical protein
MQNARGIEIRNIVLDKTGMELAVFEANIEGEWITYKSSPHIDFCQRMDGHYRAGILNMGWEELKDLHSRQ